MKVTDIRMNPEILCELDAKVKLRPTKSFDLFYRLPDELAKFLQVSADPFIAALLIPSMRLGQTLTVDAPASPTLLRTLPKIMAFYHSCDRRYKIIEVRTLQDRLESDPPSESEALFFSGGLDSFHALTKLTEQNSETNNLTHLLFVHGFDINLNDTILFQKSRTAIESIASGYGKKLVVVRTNVRELTDRNVGWNNCFGGAIASVALCFGGFFRHVYVASDAGPNERILYSGSLPYVDGMIPPDLGALWSTGTTSLINCCYGISRIEKARAVANNSLAQKYLRVCWENRNGAYNCGRCSKCIRTMLALHLAGVLSSFNFPTTLTSELVSAIDSSSDPIVTLHTEHLIHALRERGENELANALSEASRKPSVGV
jgi:hypothetical protein